jgi:hypothetical protein
MAQAADDQAPHEARIAEAHLGLGRMDVDVDRVCRKVEEQRRHGVAVLRQHVLVSAAQGARE